MTRVKICGITTVEDALAACEAGADALGLNFAPEARAKGRYIDPEAARALVAQVPPFVQTVAVCVNPTPEALRTCLGICALVQLHGEEAPALCDLAPGRVIKAFRARPGFRPADMTAYRTVAWLLDAWAPDARGGTGATCDWSLAREAVALGRPLILAGGLTPDNVAEAVRRVRPYAVDVAGGVESAPGKKDHGRLRDFVRNAKGALSLSG